MNLKKQFLPFLLLLGILLLGSSCRHSGETPHWFSAYKFYDNDAYCNYLIENVSGLTENKIQFSDQVKAFYQERKEPLWTTNGFNEENIQKLEKFIAKSDEHGISPDVFGYTTAQNLTEKLKEGKIGTEDSLYALLARIELLYTDAFIQYVKDLTYGATDPVEVNGGKWLYETIQPEADFASEVLKNADKIDEYLRSIQPTDEIYLALQQELARFLAVKDTVLPKIPYVSADSNATAKNVSKIGERLLFLQEIDANYQPTDKLDAPLMIAINQFRSRRDIPTHSALDEETIDMLNQQPQYYIDKISANLERYRWKLVHPKGSDYVAANTADYTLKAVCADTLALEMKICCGRYGASRRAKDSTLRMLKAIPTESPLLFSEINYIYLNPEWGITASILAGEYYDKFVRSNTYTAKKEKLFFIDLKTKKQVLPESIDWKKINRNKIPYKVIQSSGKHNALGLVKFSFPNSESVYLHDTNSKGKFKTRKRAYSHGCVRVEKPVELAELLFIRDFGETNTKKKEEELAELLEQYRIILGEEPETEEGEEFLEEYLKKEEEYFDSLGADTIFYRPLRPTPVHLKKRMPIYIEYFTCYIGTDNQVHYCNDGYEKEGNILYALKQLEH